MAIEVSRHVNPEEGTLSGEIFHSEEIYRQELERVFARSWLFLAHDSMIPKKGDFIQTYMGEDPVVVVRQPDGSVCAFLNQCRHRGMRICRADLGNARAFMCTFHGWTYGLAGDLIHVPHEEEAYGDSLDKSALGPRQVAQLANYKGFIFGTWDPEAPSFDEYLGDMAWYFDAHIDRYAGGLESVATHKWVIGGNWKFNAEQPASDAYHGESTHASAYQVMNGDKSVGTEPGGYQFTAPYGHGTGFGRGKRRSSGPLTAAWEEQTRDQVVERLGEARTDWARGHANIFPNFMFLGNGTMRVTHPRGPNEMEIWAWTFVPVEAPPEVKEEMRIDVLRTFSPAGLFESDDAENWLEEQRIMRGHMARQTSLLYTMQLGGERFDADGLPGRTSPHHFSDEGARGLYRHWADLMSGASWPEIIELKKRRDFEQRPSTSAPAGRQAGGGGL